MANRIIEYKKNLKKWEKEKYDILEDLQQQIRKGMLSSITCNTFYKESVEYRNLYNGDTNEFELAHDNLLMPKELKENSYTNLTRNKIGENNNVEINTSVYSLKIYRDLNNCSNFSNVIKDVRNSFNKLIKDKLFSIFNSFKMICLEEHANRLMLETKNVKNDLYSIIQNVKNVSNCNNIIIYCTECALIKYDLKYKKQYDGKIDGKIIVNSENAIDYIEIPNSSIEDYTFYILPITDENEHNMNNRNPIKFIDGGEIVATTTTYDETFEIEFSYEFAVAFLGIVYLINDISESETLEDKLDE